MKIRTIKDEKNGKTYLTKGDVQIIINPALCLISQTTTYNNFIRAAYHAVEAEFELSSERDNYGWDQLCQLCCSDDCIDIVADSINYYIGKVGGNGDNDDYIDDLVRYSLRHVFYYVPHKYPFTKFKAGKTGSKLTENIAKIIYHTDTNSIFAFKRNNEFNYICYMAVGLYRTVEKKLFSPSAISDKLYNHVGIYKSLAESVCKYYDTNTDHYLADDTWYKYAWNSNMHFKTEKDLRPWAKNQYSKFPFRNFAALLIKYNSHSIGDLNENDRAIILSDMDMINRDAAKTDVYRNGRICPLYTATDVYVATSIMIVIAKEQSMRNVYELLYAIYEKTAAKFSFGALSDNVTEAFDNDITLAIAGDIVSTFITKQVPKDEYVIHQLANSDLIQTLAFCNSFYNEYLIKEAKPDENVSNRK